MKLNNLTLFTVSFNNNILTSLMIKSFYKNVGTCETVIVDNGNQEAVNEDMKSIFTVIDNFNHKLLQNLNQCSKNHCLAIDYVLKNVIKTKWVLLVDNDVFFKPSVKEFLENFNEKEFDCAGEIGWDDAPPTRLFPYFCLINVEKFRLEQLSYFDEKRITEDPPIGKHIGIRGPNTPCWYHDTGSSFYEDIKDIWKIKEIKLDDFIVHNKTTGMPKSSIQNFISKYRNYYE